MSTAGGDKPTSAALIDIHHHIFPPLWMEKVGDPIGQPSLGWTPEMSLDGMDRAGIAAAIGSVTVPHVATLPRRDAAVVARGSNDYAAKLITDYPGRFGAFGMLPLPYIEESLNEIDYIFDTLRLDGVEVLSSYDGRWLGHDDFHPILDALSARKAAVHVHPMLWNYTAPLIPGMPLMPFIAAEIGMDTARAIVSLIFSGTSLKFSDINFIFSHGGGTLTAIVERLQLQMTDVPPFKGRITTDIVNQELRRFKYDAAQVLNSITIEALLRLVPSTQVMFGTDLPYRGLQEHVDGLARSCSGDELANIAHANVARLFPRFHA